MSCKDISVELKRCNILCEVTVTVCNIYCMENAVGYCKAERYINTLQGVRIYSTNIRASLLTLKTSKL